MFHNIALIFETIFALGKITKAKYHILIAA